MTAYETLQQAVADAQAEVKKYQDSVFSWSNAPEYLAAKAVEPYKRTAAQNAQIAASEKIINERSAQLVDWKNKLKDAIAAVTNYEATSPVVKSEIATKAATALQSADTRKILWIVGGLLFMGLIFGGIIYLIKNKTKKPTT